MIRKYWVLLKVNWQVLMEYRAGMAIWVIANTLPLVMLAVWITISSSAPVGDYGPAKFAGYYLILLLVRQLTTVWVAWELDNDIRLGELSPKLLRPINPIHSHITMHLADKLFRLFTVVPLILLAIYCVPGISYQTDPLTLSLFLLAMIWLRTHPVLHRRSVFPQALVSGPSHESETPGRCLSLLPIFSSLPARVRR